MRLTILSGFLALLFSCVTSPLGRQQLMLVSDDQMSQMGAQAFQQIRQKEPETTDPAVKKYVDCVVAPLINASRGQTSQRRWDVAVFEDQQANAFALPGGKIGVYTGILRVAKNDAQLAAVIGHEIGHVIARHGAERVSQQAGTQLGLAALGALTRENPNKNLLMGLLGAGLQVGVLLPFSRTQESEADLIGLNLMAQAGFDPKQSVELWRNMIKASGGGPPEFLSTHPASENRIVNLQSHMPDALTKYDRAQAVGRSHSCERQSSFRLSRTESW